MIHLISRQKKNLKFFFFSNLFETIPWCSAIIKATISTGGQIVARTGSLSSGIAMWSIEKKTYKVRLFSGHYLIFIYFILILSQCYKAWVRKHHVIVLCIQHANTATTYNKPNTIQFWQPGNCWPLIGRALSAQSHQKGQVI